MPSALQGTQNLSQSEAEETDNKGSENETTGADDKGLTSPLPVARPRLSSPSSNPTEYQGNRQEGFSEGSDDEDSETPPSPISQNPSSPNPSPQSQQSEEEDENKEEGGDENEEGGDENEVEGGDER